MIIFRLYLGGQNVNLYIWWNIQLAFRRVGAVILINTFVALALALALALAHALVKIF